MYEKTNVMRILDQKKIKHQTPSYVGTGAISGTEVAEALGQDPKCVFKTLVTIGKSKSNYVFVIPVEKCSTYFSTTAVPTGQPARIASNAVLPLTLSMSPQTNFASLLSGLASIAAFV